MKVTAIEEAHDITTLSLDEQFGSLCTFEIAISGREKSKEKKGIVFQFVHEDESFKKGKPSNNQVNESIVMLTKQFSNVIKNLRNPNSFGSNNHIQDNFRRRDFDR